MEEVDWPLATEEDEERVVALLTPDVVRTLGEAYTDLVRRNASRLREFVEVHEYFWRVVNDVQQQIHDEFIDTTWPRCPRHGNHPLWFRDEGWWCGEEMIARIGELSRT